MLSSDSLVVFFDGECNLCNGAVQFIIKNNTGKQLKFASLQSDFGQEILNRHNKAALNFETLFFLENGKLKERSEAIFAILKFTPKFSFLRLFRFLPTKISNFFYNIISRNRFSWFGKPQSCFLPSPEYMDRFIS